MKTALSLCLAAVAGCVVAARADLGATRHNGQGITPVDAPGIRMVSAKVDIDWGEPGKLRAIFVMDNEEATPTDVQLGFPVSLPERYRSKHGLDFTMSFDGVPIERTSIRQDTPATNKGDFPPDTIWFHCRHRFPPGKTTVAVESKLPPVAAYRRPYEDSFGYIVASAKGWKGNVGVEDIAVHFPAPIQPGQIEFFEPKPATVEGDTIRWRFVNFKPRSWEYNVNLLFVEPGVFPVLADLRRRLEADPGNARRQLALTKHLLALTSTWLSYTDAPERMTPAQRQEILRTLRSDADRARFRAFFRRASDGRYEQKKSAHSEADNDTITGMLRDVGYIPPRARTVFLREGRERLAKYLREHPHDPEARMIELNHYVGIPEYTVEAWKLDLTAAAVRDCPGDPTLQLWHDAAETVRHQPKDQEAYYRYEKVLRAKTDELVRQLRRRGVIDKTYNYKVRYPHQRSQDYYFS